MSETVKEYVSEYPKQIINDIKQTKNSGVSTFAVDALFGYQNPLPENPLYLYNVFSVYNITVIQNKKAVTVNLRPDDFTALARKSEIVFDMAFKNQYLWKSFKHFHMLFNAVIWIRNKLSGKVEENASTDQKLAFAYRLSWGKCKDKTPGDALLENADNEQELMRNRELLTQNINKYPNNKKIIQSIDAAIRLFKDGKLNKTTSENHLSASEEIVALYEGTWKNKTGKSNIKVVNNTEYYRCYRLMITYNPQMDKYPVCVSVENSFMPVQKHPDGRQNILISQALENSHIALKHIFSLDEWINIIDTMQQAKNRFGNMVYASMYKLAVQCDDRNRKNNK